MGDGRGEGRSDDQQDHSSASPWRIETRELNEEIDQVRRTVCNIRKHGQHEQAEQEIKRKLLSRTGPCQKKGPKMSQKCSRLRSLTAVSQARRPPPPPTWRQMSVENASEPRRVSRRAR